MTHIIWSEQADVDETVLFECCIIFIDPLFNPFLTSAAVKSVSSCAIKIGVIYA